MLKAAPVLRTCEMRKTPGMTVIGAAGAERAADPVLGEAVEEDDDGGDERAARGGRHG